MLWILSVGVEMSMDPQVETGDRIRNSSPLRFGGGPCIIPMLSLARRVSVRRFSVPDAADYLFACRVMTSDAAVSRAPAPATPGQPATSQAAPESSVPKAPPRK